MGCHKIHFQLRIGTGQKMSSQNMAAFGNWGLSKYCNCQFRDDLKKEMQYLTKVCAYRQVLESGNSSLACI
jgi:hypothetical protein